MGAELVERLFPFLLVIDPDLRVVAFGRAAHKTCVNLERGVALLDVVTIHRPRIEATFTALRDNGGSTFLLDSRTTGVRLRGEMSYEPASGHVMFLGSPWFTDINKLLGSGLTLGDFAVHDPIVDFLYMVQAKSLAVDDAKRYSELLVRQRDELQRTNEELERANQAKTQFLANTSHELRTPLNGIIGMASLLQRSTMSPKQESFVTKIIQSAEMLQAVVNDILDISKINAGKLKLELVDFECAAVVHDVADVFATAAHLKGVELVCMTSPNLPAGVQGDPARVRQVLANLVNNAVKFTATGEIVVRAGLEQQLDDGGAIVRFSVTDTGIGIAPDDQQLLFQPFSQLDNSMGRRFGGTGLGLAIARQLTELMGGTIGVTSAAGHGSTFSFTVRFLPSRAQPATRSGSLVGMRALVADDNATNRLYLQERLALAGAEVAVAGSGTDALALVRAAHAAGRPFDVALFDMNMPQLSGLDVALTLAGEPAHDRTVKLLLTSTEVRDDPRLGLAKVRACLLKPVRPDVLVQTLAALRDHSTTFDSTTATREIAIPKTVTADLPRAAEPEVLVVDDNPINVEVAVHMVEALGYRAEIATTGKEAVQALLKRSFKLVLMDLQMPEMDGYEATREIRTLEAGTAVHTPIVALTAHAQEADRQRALSAGLDDYLSKPVKLETLGALLAKWLGPRPSGRRRHAAGTDAPDAPNVIDVDAFIQLRRATGRDQPELATKVVRLFLDDLPSSVRGILDARAASERQRIAREAHRLKPAAAMVGALALSQICLDLETRAVEASDEALDQMVDVLAAMAKRVQKALDGWLALQRP
jgi:signal transduction histidine kinase/DNA-binding response OmpR family regulator